MAPLMTPKNALIHHLARQQSRVMKRSDIRHIDYQTFAHSLDVVVL
jgi:hypothetical protein